jgi:hypothetical protein
VADPRKTGPLSSELENRLDELFSEGGPPAPAPTAVQKRRDDAGPLGELKKIVLSIDWEITAEALDSFQDQISLLKEVYRQDKVATLLLQILGTLGHYIKSSRSNVHPSTFPLLNSVFARLDEIVSSPGMSETAKRKLLQAEVKTYQELRGKIAQRRTPQPAPRAAGAAPVTAPASARGNVVTPDMLAQAVQELKAFVRSEIDQLRLELRRGARTG